jgi:nitrogen-specific signal transduction histidine kinase
LLLELVLLTKNRVDSIKKFTQILQAKLDDKELRELFFRTIDSDIEKTDSLMNGLMNYVKVSTPIEKANTVHTLIEEVLRKHQPILEEKKTRVFKTLKKDLPETTVSDEQLEYILDSLVRYALASMSFHATMGILTRSIVLRQEADEEESFQKSGHIEILLVFTDFSKLPDRSRQRLGIPTIPKDEPTDLPLLLIKEMVQRNRGRMKFESDEKGTRTMITLSFPVERRRGVYYSAP